jgi:hypothetical protein
LVRSGWKPDVTFTPPPFTAGQQYLIRDNAAMARQVGEEYLMCYLANNLIAVAITATDADVWPKLGFDDLPLLTAAPIPLTQETRRLDKL